MTAARRVQIGLAAIAVAVGSVVLGSSGWSAADPSPDPAASTVSHTSGVSLAGGSSSETAAPTRIRIPAIGVDSPLLDLEVDGAGVLVPPADFMRAGWYRGGTVPGAVGPAVIAGHVDSYTGPAVFFRLDELAEGAEILVDRADGTTVRFTVEATHRYPKDRFPTEDVYRPTPRVELRLITCGGEFDRDQRSYRDNVVVTAAAQ